MGKPLREIKGARSGIVALCVWILSVIVIISDGIKAGRVTTIADGLNEIEGSLLFAAVVWLVLHLLHRVIEILFSPGITIDEYMKFLHRH